jgi:hypothetical protein
LQGEICEVASVKEESDDQIIIDDNNVGFDDNDSHE